MSYRKTEGERIVRSAPQRGGRSAAEAGHPPVNHPTVSVGWHCKCNKPATDDDGLKLILRDGSSFDGKEIAKTRIVDKIETTSTGRLDEGQLKQEMERFLNELNGE